MPYRAPVNDYRFLMENIVGFTQVTATEKYSEATPDMADAILTEAAKMCEGYPCPAQSQRRPAPRAFGKRQRPHLPRLCRRL